jgi:hypothetical protein
MAAAAASSDRPDLLTKDPGTKLSTVSLSFVELSVVLLVVTSCSVEPVDGIWYIGR